MKVLLTALAMAATLATPALCQTADRPTQSNQVRTSDPYESANRVREQRSTNSRNDVYGLRGEYLGSDPDPIVRNQLSRDPSQGD